MFANFVLFTNAGGVVPPAATPYIEKDLVAYLGGLGFVAYPDYIPQGAALPAISFMLVTEDHDDVLAGAAGVARSTFEITVASKSFDDCGRLAEQLRRSLQGFVQKPMGSTWVFSVQAGFAMTKPAPGVDKTGRPVHAKSREFEFHYRESIPTF